MVKHNFLFIRWLQKWLVVQQIQPGLFSLIKHYGIMRIWYDFYLVVDNWDTSDFYNKRNLKLDLKRNCSNAESHWNTWAIYCIFIIWQLRFRKTMSSFCGKVLCFFSSLFFRECCPSWLHHWLVHCQMFGVGSPFSY